MTSNPSDSSPPPSDGPPATSEVRLRRLPLWTNGLTLMVAIAGWFLVHTGFTLVPRIYDGTALATDAFGALLVLGFLLTIIGGVLAKRVYVRVRPVPPIAFHEGYVLLPRNPEVLRAQAVPYNEIMSVNEGGQDPRRHFFIESRGHVFHLPQQMFADTDGPERLFVELRQRIMNLPQGTALLEQTERRRLQAIAAMSSRALCTQLILGVIGVFFLNTYLKGAFDSPLGLLRWGANAPLLVQQGEYFRLVAANFLHGGFLPTALMSFMHVFMNGMAIHYLGTLLERLLGWQRFLLIYLASGIAAMAASAYAAKAIMSVGASGAVFGLLGGFLVVSWQVRAQLPLGLRQPVRWWVFILAVNCLLPMLWPVVDLTAHASGFVCGLVITLAMLGGRRSLPTPAGRPLTVAAAALAGLCAVALGQAVQHAASNQSDAELELAFVKSAVEAPHTDPDTLNTLAWDWAINPRSTPEQLEVAAAAAAKAIDRQPNVGEYQDTVAKVEERLGHIPVATAAEQRALDLDHSSPLYAGRLVQLFAQQTGPKAYGPGFADTALAVRVDPATSELVLENLPDRDAPFQVYAIVEHGERQVAMVHVIVGPHTTAPQRYHTDQAELPSALRSPADGPPWRAKVVRVEARAADQVPSAGKAEWFVTQIVELAP